MFEVYVKNPRGDGEAVAVVTFSEFRPSGHIMWQPSAAELKKTTRLFSTDNKNRYDARREDIISVAFSYFKAHANTDAAARRVMASIDA